MILAASRPAILNLNGDIPGTINIYSLKSDYTHPLKNDMRLDAGFKLSYVNNNNEVEYIRDDKAELGKGRPLKSFYL